jgi:hypothetical protein
LATLRADEATQATALREARERVRRLENGDELLKLTQ